MGRPRPGQIVTPQALPDSVLSLKLKTMRRSDSSPATGATADLEETKRIVLDGLKAFRVRVWLFGSFARGIPARSSDIDVAVLPMEPLPPGLLEEIRERLEGSLILYPVDLVNLAEADPGLRARVDAEGIAWTN